MKTKEEKHRKLVWGLVIGAVVGVAIGGVLLYAKKNDISIVDEIEHATKDAKKKLSRAVEDGLEELEHASHKMRKSAREALKKAMD